MLAHVPRTQYRSTGWHKKRGTFEKPNKNWRNPRKKIIDRNWTITTCLLSNSNPNYQCLKITSCRWRPPPRMHSFTATTHFKSSHSFVSPYVCCMLCRMRLCCILHTWRRPPSTGRNFQTLKIWITVSYKASCNGSISVNKFIFLDFFNFCWVFQKFPFFCVTLCIRVNIPRRYILGLILNDLYFL